METTYLYWDCECEDKYIHPSTIDKCDRCGCERDEMPDSIVDEVFYHGYPIM